MAEKYDCTQDIKEHIGKVQHWIWNITSLINNRAATHDASKLKESEKSMFDEWTPRLKTFEFGSDEYKAALVGMGEALKHHYENNCHHPEHFEHGINGMTLIDLVEMVCDWIAAAQTKGIAVDMDYLSERFDVSDMLKNIIINTLVEMEIKVTGHVAG